MRVFQRFVPAVWMCEECRSPVRTNQVVDPVDQTATSSTITNQVVDNKDSIDQTPNSKTNQVVDNEVVHQNMSTSDSYDQISVTHQPSSHAHISPVGNDETNIFFFALSVIFLSSLSIQNLRN